MTKATLFRRWRVYIFRFQTLRYSAWYRIAGDEVVESYVSPPENPELFAFGYALHLD